jgi:excisionase family DNA binding protein
LRRHRVESYRRVPAAQPCQFLTVSQAASYMGRPISAIRRLILRRCIPVVREGRCIRVDQRSLDEWIRSHTFPAAMMSLWLMLMIVGGPDAL